MTTSNHDEALREAFKALLAAEQEERHAEKALKDSQLILGNALRNRKADVEAAWNAIAALLAETGEYEARIETSNQDYIVHRTKPRGKTVVADIAAVPEEFVRVKREPDLVAIREHFSQYQPENLPNWLKFEESEGNWTWKSVKKAA